MMIGIEPNEDQLKAAMIDLAVCSRDLLVRSSEEGAELWEILLDYKLKGILEEHGLALVPQTPTSAMRTTWERGWFRSFSERYRMMLLAVWST